MVLSDMPSNTSIHNVGVPSHSVKMNDLLALTLVRVNMGPFTTEQVEDVKTLLRFLVIMFVGAIAFSVAVATGQHIQKVSEMLTDANNKSYKSFSKCYSKHLFINTFTFIPVIILPAYEFLFYPLFHRCLERITSQWTFILGVLLLIE